MTHPTFTAAAREATYQLQGAVDAAGAGQRSESAAEWLNAATSADLLRGYATNMLHAAVAAARYHGATWEQVGEHLGVTRQAAHDRFGGRR
jgi:hypothetical protein